VRRRGGELDAFAYCDKSEPDLKAKSKVVALEPDVPGSDRVKCGSVVSGGFDGPDAAPDEPDGRRNLPL
jgi:hypothetical protein